MSKSKLVTAGIALVAALATTGVRADTWMEVESARANARAGGPISEHDAELLERYGCLSGSKSTFCKNLESGRRLGYRTETPPKRKQH